MSFNYSSIEVSTTFTYKGKTIAILEGDTLRKEVRGSKHMLRSPRGWATQESVLQEAKNSGAIWVCINDVETARSYWATISDFISQGYLFDRGHGLQRVLRLTRFQKLPTGKPPSIQLPLAI